MKKTYNTSNSDVGMQNRGRVLKYIVTHEEVKRSKLVSETGLTKMSISNIIAEFNQEDITKEAVLDRDGRVGRTATKIILSERSPVIVGLLIERSGCTAILSDISLNVLRKLEVRHIHKDSSDLFEVIYSLLDPLFDSDRRIIGIGVASLGPINSQSGDILSPSNFNGIANVPIKKCLEDRYNKPVSVNNHSNCAALAEKFFGCAKDYQDILFVGITDGIGSGIILGGELYHSNSGITPELGHVSINPKGHSCSCGRKGCVEMYTSTYVIENTLNDILGARHSFLDYCMMYSDERVNKVFDIMMIELGMAILNYVNIMNPEMVIIGYEGANINKIYIERLEEYVNQHRVATQDKPIVFKSSDFERQATLYGSVCCILDQLFQGVMSIIE